MNLDAVIFLSVLFGVPVSIFVGMLLMAKHQTKGLDDALRSVGVRK